MPHSIFFFVRFICIRMKTALYWGVNKQVEQHVGPCNISCHNTLNGVRCECNNVKSIHTWIYFWNAVARFFWWKKGEIPTLSLSLSPSIPFKSLKLRGISHSKKLWKAEYFVVAFYAKTICNRKRTDIFEICWVCC